VLLVLRVTFVALLEQVDGLGVGGQGLIPPLQPLVGVPDPKVPNAVLGHQLGVLFEVD